MAAARTEIIPYIFYRDVPAALAWLARAFGFTETLRETTPSGGIHGEMMLDGQRIMMGQRGTTQRTASPRDGDIASQGVFIYLADVNAHYEKARAAGAAITASPQDLPYGRSYTAHDLEGHPWFFTTPAAGG